MPELPEVETIRRGLHERILDARIKDIQILELKTAQVEPAEIDRFVIGHKIDAVRRRAKVLMWDLDSGYTILFHLKMTGQIILDSKQKRYAGGHPSKSMDLATELPDRSTRLIFDFDDGSRLYFNDQRKFGWIKLMKTRLLNEDLFLMKIGPEPDMLANPKVARGVAANISKSRRVIKAVILDQHVIAGVGNIYADESLHLAKIHPARRAHTLSTAEIKRLLRAIVTVINDSIGRGGTSFTNYVNVEGTRGDYLQHARVFRRHGLPCRVCGSTVLKTREAGRGTHYCPTCQPEPGL